MFGCIKAITFFIFLAPLRTLQFTILSILFLYSSLISFLVSIVLNHSINLPLFLGKNSDGYFPIWSLIIFSPFLFFIRGFTRLRRLISGQTPYSEVSEGLYVGGWPSSLDKLPPGNPAIIDCTCELPRKLQVSGHGYLCVPTWDTRSPSLAAIQSAVKWACQKRAMNIPVFVHCAYGRGRSVVVMCALLVELGLAEDWKNAEKLIKEKRPFIHLNDLHRKGLEEWSKNRLSAPKVT